MYPEVHMFKRKFIFKVTSEYPAEYSHMDSIFFYEKIATLWPWEDPIEVGNSMLESLPAFGIWADAEYHSCEKL
ncbi:hypothetical protein KAALPHA_251 [Klebsiella phage vB_KaeM_KaAlpha]|uniref:Uncharacterized protein n=1 Tax=Klebsiella phage vB_KaeM_KaAlpha TaxID=2591367 RepID=A0A5B9NHY8_9CAUD|nr:hypothetical protein KAALPHA_251 [Klebsiella phage vB_KaeM_KaAlpha]